MIKVKKHKKKIKHNESSYYGLRIGDILIYQFDELKLVDFDDLQGEYYFVNTDHRNIPVTLSADVLEDMDLHRCEDCNMWMEGSDGHQESGDLGVFVCKECADEAKYGDQSWGRY